jgi:hypothetical protein
MQSSICADRDCTIWISPEKSPGITRSKNYSPLPRHRIVTPTKAKAALVGDLVRSACAKSRTLHQRLTSEHLIMITAKAARSDDSQAAPVMPPAEESLLANDGRRFIHYGVIWARENKQRG